MRSNFAIIVTGAPASGKTTIRRSIARALRRRSLLFDDLSLDGTLRAMFARGDLGDSATLQRNGSLILKSMACLPLAFDELLARASIPKRSVLVEVPVSDEWMVQFLEKNRTTHSIVVLHLRARLDIRMSRNRARTRDRISAKGMRQMSSDYRNRVYIAAARSATAFLSLDTHAPVGRVRRTCVGLSTLVLDGRLRPARRPRTRR